MLHTLANWVFALAFYGTVAFPVALGVAIWRTSSGQRTLRSLTITGGWLAYCFLAGIVRLATRDGYYTPAHVTYWDHSTTDERRTAVILLILTAVASSATLIARYRNLASPRTASGLIVIGWVTGVALVAYLSALGLH